MKLVLPRVELIKQKPGKQGIYEQIEIGARTCYKSDDKIQYDEQGNSLTARKFVDNIVNVRKHGSVAEHGTVYLKYPYKYLCDWAIYNPHTHIRTDEEGNSYVTTNFRVLQELGRVSDIDKYGIEYDKEYHSRRWMFRFYTQIAMSREANRHRVNSPSEQSTRYCNYSKDKFGNEINICVPDFVNSKELFTHKPDFRHLCSDVYNFRESEWTVIDYWLFGNLAAEFSYLGMISLGVKPENARTVLPLDTQTELIHTAFIKDWIHFLKLRLAETAHPDMIHLAYMMCFELLKADELDMKDIEFVFEINPELFINNCIKYKLVNSFNEFEELIKI